MARFVDKKMNSTIRAKAICYATAFALIVVLFLYSIDAIGKSAAERQLDSLENAVRQNVTYCYSIEGRYPPDIDYLEQNYGLSYDKNHFFVGYRLEASNIMPDITVIAREE